MSSFESDGKCVLYGGLSSLYGGLCAQCERPEWDSDPVSEGRRMKVCFVCSSRISRLVLGMHLVWPSDRCELIEHCAAQWTE